MNKPITALMDREMTRQEFLATLGFGLASILGFSNLIHFLTGKSATSRFHRSESAVGYGNSSYGGGKE